MDQASFMGQDELGKIYGEGSWNALEQGNQQVGLANMYQNQRAQANALENEKNTLANLYSSQNDPQRIENQRLTNEGLVNTNMLGGVNARRAAANEGMQLTQDQRDFAIKASDSDLRQAEQHAQGEMQSGDPRRMAEAAKILDFTVAARTAKSKAASDLAQTQEQTRSHLAGIGMQTKAQKDINQSNIEAGKFNKKGAAAQGVAGIQQAVTSGKMTAEKAAVALFGAAMFEPDPELKKQYEQMAGQYEQFAMQQRNAQAQGKLNTGAQTGLPTRNLPPALGMPGASTPKAPVAHSLADVAKMYPGVPADKIKQAYKQKFGVDLQ